jgi:hypothetical protein
MFTIKETKADGSEKTVAKYGEVGEERDLMWNAWDDWLIIAEATKSKVVLYKGDMPFSSYDQRDR